MDPGRSTLPQTVLASAEGTDVEPLRLMVQLHKALRVRHYDSLRTGMPGKPVLAGMKAHAVCRGVKRAQILAGAIFVGDVEFPLFVVAMHLQTTRMCMQGPWPA